MSQGGVVRGTLLVCGSRTWTDQDTVDEVLGREMTRHTEIIHGGAKGADQCAADFCKRAFVPSRVFLPDWERYGRKAGFIRNRQMIEEGPFLVIAFWDGKSPGTKSTLDLADKADIRVKVVTA